MDRAHTWPGRAILHVDLDAFFAAVEQLDHPEWRGRPVIVGGAASQRGVVSTASYEARVFGVRSAMPSARARKLCPEAIWAPPRFDRYQELAARVRDIFWDESPHVQPVSIDEAYLDVTPGSFTAEDPVLIAERIRARIAQLGITASVGVATSKTVAKIASDMDKPDGLTVVRPGSEASFLSPLTVRFMPGIGPRTAERLTSLGLRTLGDVASMDLITAEQVLGSHGRSLVRRAAGIDDRRVHENEPVKSVSNERTFAEDVRSADEVMRWVDRLSAKVGSRLRRKGLAGRTVTVKVRFADFTTKTAQRTLAELTDDETCFGPVAVELVRSLWTPGAGVRLLGVGMSGFEERGVQLDLLPARAESGGHDKVIERRTRLGDGLDAVRERFGDGAIKRGRDLGARHRGPDLGDDSGGSVGH